MSGSPCLLCGWLELHENEDGSLDCRECVWEWPSREAYLAEVDDFIRGEWGHQDLFLRGVLANRPLEATLRKAAVALLRKDVDPDIVWMLLGGINAAAPTPAAPGRLREVFLEAVVAA